jgi:hypothetical protein
LRFGETDDAAHASAFVAWDGWIDGVDRVSGVTGGVQFQVWIGGEALLRWVVLEYVDGSFGRLDEGIV